MRKIEPCVECGEPREIAAHGLCFTCYRRKDRELHLGTAVVDRHSPALRREHKKMIRAFAAVMGGLSDLAVNKPDVLAIRKLLLPYLEPVADFLGVAPRSEGPVNSEQRGYQFTVHTRGPIGPVKKEV